MSSLPLPIPADPVAGASGQLDFSIWAKQAIQALDLVQPVGAIIMYGGTVAPTGWHLCDGTAHGSTDLAAVIGNPNTPNLRDKFIVGAGSAYAQGASGGQASVTLGISNLPSHSHGGVVGVDNAPHAHDLNYSNMWITTYNEGHAGGYYNVFVATAATMGSTGTNNASHQHTIPAEGSATAIDNRPPYYALTYIIKK